MSLAELPGSVRRTVVRVRSGLGCGRARLRNVEAAVVIDCQKVLRLEYEWDKMGGSSSNNCEISLKVREYSSFWLLTNLSREEESQENFSSVAHDHIEL